jgi:uncharacterized protein
MLWSLRDVKMTAHMRTILWNNRAQENYDCCSLFQTESGFRLEGLAILKEVTVPMRVRYHVDCNLEWRTQSVDLRVWNGDHEQHLTLYVDDEQRWWHNESELVECRGLIDVDLAFTPATNTLAMRRMKLRENGSEMTTTVWVQFPTLEIVRYPQRYTRLSQDEYLFESLDNSFKARLLVDELGLVKDYEGLWHQTAWTN